jgi:hypothetical protein
MKRRTVVSKVQAWSKMIAIAGVYETRAVILGFQELDRANDSAPLQPIYILEHAAAKQRRVRASGDGSTLCGGNRNASIRGMNG